MQDPEKNTIVAGHTDHTASTVPSSILTRRTLFVGAAAFASLVAVLLASLLFSSSSPTIALSTPITASLRVSQSSNTLASGSISLESRSEWRLELLLENDLTGQSPVQMEQVSTGGSQFTRTNGGEWIEVPDDPGSRQPIAGLGDLGRPDLLFVAVLDRIKLNATGSAILNDQQLAAFSGTDDDFTNRYPSFSQSSDIDAANTKAAVEFYSNNPPAIRMLADESDMIQRISVDVPQQNADPVHLVVEITSSGADVTIPDVSG